MARLYTINPEAFAIIKNEQQAYCLGFLLADGWVSSGGKGIAVAVHEQDTSVLNYIQKTCGSNAPLFIKTRTSGFNGSALVGVNLCSKAMVRDLAALGLVRNKSASTFLPKLQPNLLRHLLRGLFDGDGSIGTRQFWLTGSRDILNDVVEVGRRLETTLSIGSNNNYPRIWGGIKAAGFLHWMYADCEFALPRKLAIYKENWQVPGRSWTDYSFVTV
jgi:intein/homing endonuclease